MTDKNHISASESIQIAKWLEPHWKAQGNVQRAQKAAGVFFGLSKESGYTKSAQVGQMYAIYYAGLSSIWSISAHFSAKGASSINMLACAGLITTATYGLYHLPSAISAISGIGREIKQQKEKHPSALKAFSKVCKKVVVKQQLAAPEIIRHQLVQRTILIFIGVPSALIMGGLRALKIIKKEADLGGLMNTGPLIRLFESLESARLKREQERVGARGELLKKDPSEHFEFIYQQWAGHFVMQKQNSLPFPEYHDFTGIPGITEQAAEKMWYHLCQKTPHNIKNITAESVSALVEDSVNNQTPGWFKPAEGLPSLATLVSFCLKHGNPGLYEKHDHFAKGLQAEEEAAILKAHVGDLIPMTVSHTDPLNASGSKSIPAHASKSPRQRL